jgi:hypothetical protein
MDSLRKIGGPEEDDRARAVVGAQREAVKEARKARKARERSAAEELLPPLPGKGAVAEKKEELGPGGGGAAGQGSA